jgi:hypothetical protein
MLFAGIQHDLLKVVATAICFGACALTVPGQEPVQQLTAPPPPKVISKDEQVQLDTAKDQKTRVKLFISLAESHLLLAEQYTVQPNFEAASAEIGKYHALVDEALEFLASLKHDSNKTRDLYKRIELALRAHGPRLTSMRRTTPLEYAVWIKEVEEFARNGRTEALNSFYGHTVVRDPQKKSEKEKKPSDQSRKDNSLVPEKRP